MTNNKNIKNYNHYLWIFISLNIIIFMVIILNKDFNFMNETYKTLFLERGVIFTASTVVTFILNGILTSKFKTKLVFLKMKNIYPACKVFTELIYKDDRIDKSLLTYKYETLPEKPQAQNNLWYQIYKKHEFDPMVFNSHRSFLISRDLTGLSFVFLFIYLIASSIAFFISNIPISWFILYIIYLLLQYFLLSLVGRNHGKRFVCNVIAKECSEIKNL